MREWLERDIHGAADVGLVGAPISRASISPSQAWSTPPAFRDALARFPTWDAASAANITDLAAVDLGDVEGDRGDADASAAHARIEAAVVAAAPSVGLVTLAGGDNSLTRPAFTAMTRARAGLRWGLLTVDAHHDCRPADRGSSNGSPVRELIEAGLAGDRVAQVGIHPLGNVREHAQWAVQQGVHIHDVEEVRRDGMATCFAAALAELRRAGAEAVYVDLDLDVVDRAFAPACPASLPGGLAPMDLLVAARLAGRDPGVLAVDLCEVDALADVAGTTVRLMAAVFTAVCAGLVHRPMDGDPR
jgi:formiminoglutamase